MTDDTMTAEGMLHLLKAEPTLLPAAPDDADGQEIEHRRLHEAHPCLRCGQPARCAYIADTEIGKRWLDLCPGCNRWLLDGLNRSEREDRP